MDIEVEIEEEENPYDEDSPQWLLWEKVAKYERIAREATDTANIAAGKAAEYSGALERLTK